MSDDAPAPCRCLGFKVLERPDGSLQTCPCAVGPALWTRAGIPERFHGAEEIESTESVYLWGAPGGGKSWEAASRLKGFLRTRPGGLFVYMPTLEAERRAAVTLGSDLPGERFIGAPFLVIDDFLRGPRVTEFWEEYLLQLVSVRHGRKLPTVYTSNHPLEYVDEKLGEHLASRILEMCGGANVRHVDQPNRRLA